MRAETFSYLPPMTREQVEAQVRWILGRSLIPAVEFTPRPGPANRYWSMWKLPLFGAKAADEVLSEIDACVAERPDSWVRVVGYDPAHGGLGADFAVARPGPDQADPRGALVG